MNTTMKSLLGVALLSAAASASANLTLVPGTPAVSGPHNDVIGDGISGYYGANIEITGPVEITFEYLGYEAAWENTFWVTDDDSTDTFENNGVSTVGDSFSSSFSASSGFLDFGFTVHPTDGGADNSVTNGGNAMPGGGNSNFWVGGIEAVAGGYTFLIALDDLGAGPDDNHDDLVVRATLTTGRITTVPEPTSLALLGLGLAGLGFARRNSKQS